MLEKNDVSKVDNGMLILKLKAKSYDLIAMIELYNENIKKTAIEIKKNAQAIFELDKEDKENKDKE